MIPKGWYIKKLEDCLERLIDYRGKSPPKHESGIPLITARNVRDGFLDFSEQEYVNEDEYETWMSRGIPQPGDLLFTTEAPLGKVALFPAHGKYAVAQRTVTLRPDPAILNSVYLLNYFLSAQGSRKVQTRGTGSTATGIKQSELRKITVLLPPIEEQRKIAGILSTWDEAIRLTQALIAGKQQRKKGLMQRLLTGQVRFPEFAERPGFQETSFGQLPVDWQYVPIGKIAHHVSQKNIKNKDLTVLSCTKYDGLVDSLEYFGRQIFSDDISTYKIVKRGQFAYATNHIEEGSIGYQDLYDEALISPMYTVFETNDMINDSFLYRVLKTELYRHIFEISTNGTVNRRGSLRWPEFSNIKVPMPSIEEQERIAEFFTACDREIQLFQQKLAALQQQKKGLMQRLLTGEVRVVPPVPGKGQTAPK